MSFRRQCVSEHMYLLMDMDSTVTCKYDPKGGNIRRVLIPLFMNLLPLSQTLLYASGLSMQANQVRVPSTSRNLGAGHSNFQSEDLGLDPCWRSKRGRGRRDIQLKDNQIDTIKRPSEDRGSPLFPRLILGGLIRLLFCILMQPVPFLLR